MNIHETQSSTTPPVPKDHNPLDRQDPMKPSAPPETTPDPFRAKEFELNWTKSDIEQRVGFAGGRFTNVNRVLTLIAAVALSAAFYAVVIYAVKPGHPDFLWFADMFLERGIVPYPIVLFFFWSLSILFVKWRKLAFQRKALDLAAVPQNPDFTLNADTAKGVLERIHTLVDNTHHFILLNRIERALSNLRNIGQISDVSSILKTQSEYDEEQTQSSYSLVVGFIWAIPVLGFIGTVIGLSQAIGAFGLTLRAGTDLESIKESLQGVTGGLSTAFETTLIALVGALLIQLLLTFLQNRENEFLDACNDYCHAHVISKLKLSLPS